MHGGKTERHMGIGIQTTEQRKHGFYRQHVISLGVFRGIERYGTGDERKA